MSQQSLAGIALIVVPILFNAGFALLGQRFDYPDVLRGRRTRSSSAFRPVAPR